MKVEYHFCSKDPEHKGCKPGSQQACRHLKELPEEKKSVYGISCPYFMYRKESDYGVQERSG